MVHGFFQYSVYKDFFYLSIVFLSLYFGLFGFSVKIIAAAETGLCSRIENIDSKKNLDNLQSTLNNDQKPLIAIVIDDLGRDTEILHRVIDLHPSVTLAFFPFEAEAAVLARRAISVGHEVLIHMPMEPLDGSIDPGPGALLLNLPFQDILVRLRAAFKLLPNAIGLNNHMGSKFTADENSMSTVIGELKARDMIFLDSRTTPDTKGIFVARKRYVQSASRDVFLDNSRQPDAILAQLSLAEAISRDKGFSVAIGHPYPETISALETWLLNIEIRGYSPVPISKVACK